MHRLKQITVGFALTGSFCTFDTALVAMEKLVDEGYAVLPVMSFNAANTDTRFGSAQHFKERIGQITPLPIIDTITAAEPVGPKKMCDILIVAPCTGNTAGKLAAGITDTPVTMAVKSHLRNKRPVVLALSTNDALAGAAKNIGELLNRKYYYFVPVAQDASDTKPTSLVADFGLISETLELALQGQQIQPILK
jgi:dipicolinate synthase subunit B